MGRNLRNCGGYGWDSGMCWCFIVILMCVRLLRVVYKLLLCVGLVAIRLRYVLSNLPQNKWPAVAMIHAKGRGY